MLPFRTFLVLCFAFRSTVSFENTVFEKNVGTASGFAFVHVDAQLFQRQLVKRPSFISCTAFAPSLRMRYLHLRGYISELSILSH